MIILLSLVLMACDSSPETSLVAYIDNIKSRSTLPIEHIHKLDNLTVFHYPEHDNRPSPFKQKLSKTDDDKVILNINRVKQFLEQFSLESLSFVGVLKRGSTIWALISHNGGEISYIKRGGYMGKNEGRVIKIGDDFLQLEERFQVAGTWTKKIKDLVLYSPK